MELLLLVVDERDKRGDEVSIGDRPGFTGVDCVGVGVVLVVVMIKGRRTGGGYFLIVAIAATVAGGDVSLGDEGFRRLIGPGRFSESHDDADRCTP